MLVTELKIRKKRNWQDDVTNQEKKVSDKNELGAKKSFRA